MKIRIFSLLLGVIGLFYWAWYTTSFLDYFIPVVSGALVGLGTGMIPNRKLLPRTKAPQEKGE
jgi:hypothetical protein